MANVRQETTITRLLDLNGEIRSISEKMVDLLSNNSDKFSQDDILENLEMLQDNVDKLCELSNEKDSPFISDEVIINHYSDFLVTISNEYLALKCDILKKEIKN